MKIQMQPNFTTQAAPKYRYVKVRNARPEAASIFLYIGRAVEHFDALRRELGNGWMLGSIADAERSLRALEQQSCYITAVFVDEVPAQLDNLSALSSLRKHSMLRDAAFIGNFRGVQPEMLRQVRSRFVFDEMIDFRVETALLTEKLDMIRRIRLAICEKGNAIRLETSPAQVCGQYHIGKRMVDLTVASLVLLVTIPVILLIALAIKLESRGPVLYNSYRAGRGYRIFKFFKFRTMKVGADRMIQSIAHLNKYNNFGHAPVFFKADNDPRITRVGKFLRNSGLDELPQLLNVLLGDMSIVGNRPLPLYEASALTNNEWADRFMAPAGITGLWQVTCRNAEGFTTADRINVDLEYARKNSMLMDVIILAKTPVVLVRGFIMDTEHAPLVKPVIRPSFKPEFTQI